MKKSELIFAFIAGCVVGLTGGIAVHDFSLAAHAGEAMSCKDRPDTVAYYMRKPGENHGIESCQHVMRFGDPRWIPDFQSPLMPRREGE